MSKYDTYTSPLAERNASPEMLRLWSARHKFNTWRRIWLAVAEAQHELTLGWAGTSGTGASGPLVTKEQVEELRAVVTRANPDGSVGITDDEIRLAEKYERELRHDVMAHVHALGDSCPKAKGIIHLGMTSQDVVCNADILTLRDAVDIVWHKVQRVISALGDQAVRHASVPTLGMTHYQPAQPVTVGRRCAQWADELALSASRMRWSGSTHLMLKGFKGATGTQASYLSLFDGDAHKIDEFEVVACLKLSCRLLRDEIGGLDHDEMASTIARNKAMLQGMVDRLSKLGDQNGARNYAEDMERLYGGDVAQERRRRLDTGRMYLHSVVGQTYPRVVDTFILADLASTASVLHKIATDIRLLCNRKELDEPFETKQIGSSAMPYKRNPMRCERICGLTRFVMNLVGNAYDTAATQWLERTLDDSSNRRLSLPEAFLALDGALDLMHNVASGLIVHEATVRKNLMAELPFMATENILMECVKLGGDRQEFHELIRGHAQAAGLRVKDEGLDNDLIDRLKNDKAFWPASRGGTHGLKGELNWGDSDSTTGATGGGLLDPMKYIGRSIEQTERFIKEVVEPLREQYGEAIEMLGQSGPRV